MITSRQKLILKAIIEHYVKEAQPIGSKILTTLPYLNFSSATLRYDMQMLEELGYLEKTHTSSGRIPSEKGYKYYVEHLVTRDHDVLSNFPLIDQVFSKNKWAREEAVKEAIGLLSDLTNYTALALGPSNKSSLIKKIDFILVNPSEAVILIVTDKGHVQHQTLQIPNTMPANEVKKVINTLDDLLKDKPLDEAANVLKLEYAYSEIESFMNYQDQLIESFIDAFAKFSQDNFYLSGITNIFDQPEFHNINHVKKLMNTLNRRDLLKVIGEDHGLKIKLGSDLEILALDNCTLISVPYRVSDTEHGTIAVIGPSRMEYKKVIPLVEYVAGNIGKLYKKDKG